MQCPYRGISGGQISIPEEIYSGGLKVNALKVLGRGHSHPKEWMWVAIKSIYGVNRGSVAGARNSSVKRLTLVTESSRAEYPKGEKSDE